MKRFLSIVAVLAFGSIASAQTGVTNVRILRNGGFAPDIKVNMGPSPYDVWGGRFNNSAYVAPGGRAGGGDNPYYTPRSVANPLFVLNPFCRQNPDEVRAIEAINAKR